VGVRTGHLGKLGIIVLTARCVWRVSMEYWSCIRDEVAFSIGSGVSFRLGGRIYGECILGWHVR